jgi:hypothetical protein
MAQTRNLLLLCACLSRETTRRAVGLLAGEIHSPDLDWEGIISIAGRHLLLPAMPNALVNKRLISALPTVVRNFLDEAYRLNTARNQRLKAQSSEIVRSLSRAEITSVLLKGGAFLFDCKYEDLGMRMMLDLDILVPEDRFEESVAVLRHLGYERCGDSHLQVTDPQHYPALFRPGEIATVELHRRLEEQEHLLPPGLVFDHSDTLKDGNSYVCIPSSTHRIMHNISHAAIDHGEYLSWSISLKALYDLMMISEAHPTTVKLGRHQRGNASLWLHSRARGVHLLSLASSQVACAPGGPPNMACRIALSTMPRSRGRPQIRYKANNDPVAT